MSLALNVAWLILACVAFLFNRISLETLMIFVVLMRICMTIEEKEVLRINLVREKETEECKPD